MFQGLNKQLLKLFLEARRLRRFNINNNVESSSIYSDILHLIITAIGVILLRRGFSDSFVSLIYNSISIMIGLFITALVFSFDKFYEKNNEKYPTSRQILLEKQDFNYTRIFTYITGYTILLGIFIMILLVPNTLGLFKMNFDLFDLSWSVEKLTVSKIQLFFKALLLLTHRFLVIFLLIEIVVNTLFIVSSMVNHMKAKMER